MREEHSLTLERADENENCRSQLDGIFSELELSQRQKIELEEQIIRLQEESNVNNIEMKKNQMEKEILLTNNENFIQEIQSKSDADSKLKNKIKETTENLDNINYQFLSAYEKLSEKEKIMGEKEEEYNDLVSSLVALEISKNEEKIEFETHINNLVDEMEKMKNENDEILDDKNEELKKAWTDLLLSENVLHALQKSNADKERSENLILEDLKKELIEAKEKIIILKEEHSLAIKECSSGEDKDTVEELLSSNGLLISQITELRQNNHLQTRKNENDNLNHKNEMKELINNFTLKEKSIREETENYKIVSNELRERMIELEKEINEKEEEILLLSSNGNTLMNKGRNDQNDIIKTSQEDMKFKLNEILNELIIKTDEVERLSILMLEKENEVRTLTAGLSGKENEVVTLTAGLSVKESEVMTLTAALSGKENEVMTLTAALSGKESEVMTLTAALSGKEDEVMTLAAALSGKEDEVMTLTAALFGKENEVVTLTAALSGKESEVMTLTAALSGKENEVMTLTAALSGKEDEVMTLTAALSGKEDEVMTLTAALSGNEDEVRTLTAALSGKETEVRTLTAALSDEETADKTLTAVLSARENEVKALTAAISEKEDEMAAAKLKSFETVSVQQNEIEELEKKLKEKAYSLDELQTRYEEMYALSAEHNTLNVNIFGENEILRTETTGLSGKQFFNSSLNGLHIVIYPHPSRRIYLFTASSSSSSTSSSSLPPLLTPPPLLLFNPLLSTLINQQQPTKQPI